jgi:hypothetical protein
MALYPHAAPDSQGLPLDLAGAVAMVTLLVLLISAATADRTGRAGAGVLAVASVVWLFVNGPMEGSVLYTVTYEHGLTAADLVGLAGLGIAGWRLWRRSRHPPR